PHTPAAPSSNVTVAPVWCTPVPEQVQDEAVYPASVVSDNVYTTLAVATVAGTSPPASVITAPAVGVALKTKSFSTALPPLSLTTVLFNARVGATSLFVIAQTPAAPKLSVTVLPDWLTPVPVHTQAEAE